MLVTIFTSSSKQICNQKLFFYIMAAILNKLAIKKYWRFSRLAASGFAISSFGIDETIKYANYYYVKKVTVEMCVYDAMAAILNN